MSDEVLRNTRLSSSAASASLLGQLFPPTLLGLGFYTVAIFSCLSAVVDGTYCLKRLTRTFPWGRGIPFCNLAPKGCLIEI